MVIIKRGSEKGSVVKKEVVVTDLEAGTLDIFQQIWLIIVIGKKNEQDALVENKVEQGCRSFIDGVHISVEN